MKNLRKDAKINKLKNLAIKKLVLSISTFALIFGGVSFGSVSFGSVAAHADDAKIGGDELQSQSEIISEVVNSEEALELGLDVATGAVDEVPEAAQVDVSEAQWAQLDASSEEAAGEPVQVVTLAAPITICSENSVQIGEVFYNLANIAEHKAVVEKIAPVVGQQLNIPAHFTLNAECGALAGQWTVSEIGFRAARGNSTIKDVTIPNTVTLIGEEAFLGSSVEQVNFAAGSTVQKIGQFAFAYTDHIINFDLPDAVRTIDDGAFASSSALQSVNVSATASQLVSIGNKAFIYCKSLLNFHVPAHVTVIDTLAFAVTGLQSFTFENSATQMPVITDLSFAYNHALTNIRIPRGVQSIDYGAFAETNLKALTFEDGSQLKNISEKAFAYSFLYDVKLPNSVMVIGDWAFADAKLSGITLPSSLLSIGTGAFAYNNFTNVVIPESVRLIGSMAFGATGVQAVRFAGVVVPEIAAKDAGNAQYGSFGSGSPLLTYTCAGGVAGTVPGVLGGYNVLKCGV